HGAGCDGTGEALEEVGKDHPAVAAGADDPRLRGLPGHGRGGPGVEPPEPVRDAADGQGEVRSGVAVGYGKDVDAIELRAVELRVLAGGEERTAEAPAIQVTDSRRGHFRS